MSASGLHAGETVDPGRHVAIVAGVGLQFQEYGQRPRRFAGAVEEGAEVVEEFASRLRRGCRRLGRPLKPLDGQRRLAAAFMASRSVVSIGKASPRAWACANS